VFKEGDTQPFASFPPSNKSNSNDSTIRNGIRSTLTWAGPFPMVNIIRDNGQQERNTTNDKTPDTAIDV
jgi:hypothetical protein